MKKSAEISLKFCTYLCNYQSIQLWGGSFTLVDPIPSHCFSIKEAFEPSFANSLIAFSSSSFSFSSTLLLKKKSSSVQSLASFPVMHSYYGIFSNFKLLFNVNINIIVITCSVQGKSYTLVCLCLCVCT